MSLPLFELVVYLLQVVLIILYGTVVEYDAGALPGSDEAVNLLYMAKIYAFFQDVHVMIFVGFGFLMVFLKTHCWTSVGYNFLIATFCIQLTILWLGVWHPLVAGHEVHKIKLNIESLIAGDFGAAAVLITFGAVLGRCSV